MKLHTLPQKQLHKLVIDKMLKDNPHLKLGDWMKGPVGLACAGRLLEAGDVEDINEKDVLEARTIRVPYDANGKLASMEMSVGGYFHPYIIGCVGGLEIQNDPRNAEVGGTVVLMNSHTFELQEHKVTAELQEIWRNVQVRFAISGKFHRDEQASFE